MTNLIPQKFGQQDEAFGVLGPGDDLDGDAEGALCPGGELLAAVAVVGPDQQDLGVIGVQAGEEDAGGIAVLDVGGGDEEVDEEAVGRPGDVFSCH
ncbi:hypothetical protein QF030_000307 [Streptomyces rishiriensis]|uniref:Uncharacterized protein n=1 Tax=Streptomyces rishiriensis TaxID=68264 RepID=A0ABU0NGA1_STRRH|nr:hypothetical protein [Streptomyces rishiriensis]MDQ0578129.1 hypothetical protein [Streptomyces rishiriensis]